MMCHKKPGSRAQSRVLDENHEMILIALVMENPCMYLREMCLEIRSATAIDVSGSLCRTLKRHGFTRKRIKLVAKQRSLIYRFYFMAQVLVLNTAHFVWIDETRCDGHNYVQKFGYALQGLAIKS